MTKPSTNGTPVTNSQLNDKLESLRWEVRFLVVVALILGQVGGHLVGVASAAIF